METVMGLAIIGVVVVSGIATLLALYIANRDLEDI